MRQLKREVVQELRHQNSHFHIRNPASNVSWSWRLKGFGYLRFADTVARTVRERLVDISAIVQELGRRVVEPSFWKELAGTSEIDI